MSQANTVPIQVVIADADTDELIRTRALLSQDPAMQVVATTTERHDLPLLLEAEPNILLLSTTIDPRDTTALVKQVLELSPRTQVLLVAEDANTVDLRRAMLAGARGILQRPLHSVELLNTIHELIENQTVRRQRVDEITRQRQAKAEQGRIITLFSPKGGVGCTVLAANLAVALRQATQKRVALVDYSLQFGNIGALLNLQSVHTLAELVPHYRGIDATLLGDVLVTHPSGVQVLLPPATLDQVDLVSTESLIGILEGLRANFDYVVVDLWHAIEDATLAVMELSDTLLLVTTPELPALYTLRRFLDALRNYPELRNKPQLLVNRHPSKGSVELSEIEQSLGLDVLATVPSDGQLIVAGINEGVPMVQKQAGSVAARQLSQLAQRLSEATTAPLPGAGLPATPPARRFPALWRRSNA